MAIGCHRGPARGSALGRIDRAHQPEHWKTSWLINPLLYPASKKAKILMTSFGQQRRLFSRPWMGRLHGSDHPIGTQVAAALGAPLPAQVTKTGT